MHKRIIKILFIVILLFSQNIVYAEDEEMEETFQEQMENFGIQSFIKNSKEYTGTFFEGMDINEILNSAISGEVNNEQFFKKIFSLLGTEVKTGIKTLLSNNHSYT